MVEQFRLSSCERLIILGSKLSETLVGRKSHVNISMMLFHNNGTRFHW